MENTAYDGQQQIAALPFRLEWIKKEVDILEHKIEFYDDLSVKLKNWTVVSWFALVSYAITHNDWRVAAFSPLLPVLFMVTEASYKRFQMDFILRTRHIMAFLNDPEQSARWLKDDGTTSFPIYDILNIYGDKHQHDPLSQKWGSLWVPFKKLSVSLLYWCLMVFGIFVTVVLAILT